MAFIRNVNGYYWTGLLWGPIEAAEGYDSPDECPEEIDYGGELAVAEDESTGFQDRVAYYVEGDEEPVASASWPPDDSLMTW